VGGSDRREDLIIIYFTDFLTLTALTVDLPSTVDRKKKCNSKALDELYLAGSSDKKSTE
jgi:hypothetical protein